MNEEQWRGKLAKHDDTREELITEISRLKNNLAEEKIAHEENLYQVKQMLRSEEVLLLFGSACCFIKMEFISIGAKNRST